MTRRGRHPRRPHRKGGGRVTPKGTRPRGGRPSHLRSVPDPEPGVPRFFDELDLAVREDDPLSFLMQVSSILNAFDPRNANPFDRAGRADDGDLPDLVGFVDTLGSLATATTTNLLGGIAMLATDETIRDRCRQLLATRAPTTPVWLTGHDGVEVTDVIQQVHVLGDGDNFIFGVALPGGYAFTLVVYVDHNLGHVVKDAFPLPEPFDAAIAQMQRLIDDPDVSWERPGSATARARVADAVRVGAMTWPPLETDSWPATRPLLERLLAGLPDGGEGYLPGGDFDTRAERVTREAADAFFASPFGADLDDVDNRGLFETLCWFGTGYGSNDLLQWSPVRVEILFTDWLPRKVIAPFEYLALAPELVEAFIRFAHDERDIPGELTAQTLQALHQVVPEFLEAVDDASSGDFDDLALHEDPGADVPAAMAEVFDEDDDAWLVRSVEGLLEQLAASVGGPGALAALDTTPLGDEPMDFTDVAADIRAEVEAVAGHIDRVCTEVLNVEYRTACRRLLHGVTVANPTVFRRGANPVNTAAAVAWVIGKTNHLFIAPDDEDVPGRLHLKIGELMGHFGSRSVASRGRSLAGALGADGNVLERHGLGDVRYLVATRRAAVIQERRDLEDMLDYYGG